MILHVKEDEHNVLIIYSLTAFLTTNLIQCRWMVCSDYSRQGHSVETIQVFDILTAVLWNLASCSRIGRYRRFGETFCLSNLGRVNAFCL